MLLFLQKDDVRKNKSLNEKSTMVISSRLGLRQEICQKIRMGGVSQVEEINANFLTSDKIELPEFLNGVIIDIENYKDTAKAVSIIYSKIPRDCWCVVVGDIDSIAVAQKFSESGIAYFYSTFQLNDMVEQIASGLPKVGGRKAINISVLGCKGGIGTTLLSYQLSRSITHAKSLPLLLLQGDNGSHDIDLLLGKKLNQDVIAYNDNLDLKRETSVFSPDFSQEDYGNYNFIVFDQNIHNCEKEQLNQLAENTQCAILLIDYSMSSVRVARKFLDEYERVQRSNVRSSRRLFICLNESRPALDARLSLTDLQTLLGHPITISLPYVKKAGEKLMAPGLWKTGRKQPLDQLMRYVLGVEEAKNNKQNAPMLTQLRHLFSR
ncbi:hypothetical protein [Pragia fontium]|uniref:hypothetical protein n=1 Tax=Pragia fontium TaxID=82985 RepID=UPI00064AAAD9|nr:hypothetical protein [Pragia fontium]AKJ41122.1 hypothetical protein QQ39_02675 [Pragia fontium]